MSEKSARSGLQGPPWILHFGAHSQFVAGVQNAAVDLDLTATSWWRSAARNAAVGGHPYSQHLVGWALDVAGPDQQQFAKRARQLGLIAVQEADHVHVQLFPAGILQRLFG